MKRTPKLLSDLDMGMTRLGKDGGQSGHPRRDETPVTELNDEGDDSVGSPGDEEQDDQDEDDLGGLESGAERMGDLGDVIARRQVRLKSHSSCTRIEGS